MFTPVNAISSWPSEATPLPAVPRGMSGEEFEHWVVGEQVRAEWVDGEVIIMSPASIEHSDLNAWFATVLRTFVKRHNFGRAIGPDFLVRMPGVRTQRIPDVLVVRHSREHLIGRTVLDGAPDLALEITSPDSVARDWREKYLEYESVGVEEYWIVDPLAKRIEAYHRGENGKYVTIAENEGKVASVMLSGFYVRLAWLWGEEPLDAIDALAELGILPTPP